ncbi:MAG TPA: alpha-2-macroglobulin family protein, partial [Desulfobacteraceae bacterium]|nr:alpha-2-macroglobulin family protein [Desulfobacteraceae bacterium]
YHIRVSKGLTAVDGTLLEEEGAFEITTRSAAPMITFGSRGFILASKLIRGLPVDSLNIKQADIDFFRIRPDKTHAFKARFRSNDKLYYYESRELAKMADLVYSGRWDLDIKKDLRTQVNIPITHIEELKPPGIYFAVLKGAGHYEYGYTTTWFTISDLGIHARVYDRQMAFYVQSLASAAPVKDARVEGFDKKGKSLFVRSTDDTGRADVAERFDALSLVSVTKGSHISLLPMDAPAMDLSEFKTGTAPFRPVDLFVYGPRDIYRPGETVYLDGILRNQDGAMTPGVPLQAKVLRPDGRMIREFTWKPGPQNHFYTDFQLPANALTGRWRVEFTHGTGRLADYPFIVSEFLPERMKLDIVADDEENIISPDQSLEISLQGDFLYGAPAAGSRANALVHVKPARELFKDKWPGYEFGNNFSLINTSFTTDDIKLDDTGKGRIEVANHWQEASSPHWITANVSLYDSGGRPVVRNHSWQVWPASALVGIRNLTATEDDPGQVPNDSTAQFEVIFTGLKGERLAAEGLKATVIREHREYYWEYKNGEWHWGVNSQFYPVDRMTLDIPENGSGRVAFPVEWGGYRLEILNPATGLTSSYEIWAGWRPEAQGQSAMNRPDRVDLSLDKPAYTPGDTARITVKAPEGGRGYLFVEGNTNLLTLPIDLPAGGKAFDIKIDPAWQRHDLYISALVIRPGEAGEARLPKRSVGLTALPLDRTDRKLSVKIQAPDKTEPNRKIRIPVSLSSPEGRVPEAAWVTLAAVDVGILNLTGFKTPSPWDYFFQTRGYGVELQDVYQRLIEANDGENARQRFGGDAPTLTRGGDRPSTDVQIVAIHRKAVTADEQGNTVFELDLPDFDGSLRLMAVAHTETEYGSCDREMILASPLVVQATMPRFLASGDRAELLLELHNLTQDTQTLTLTPEIFGPVRIAESAEGDTVRELSLAPKAKTKVRLPLLAGTKSGRANITCRIAGLRVDGASREIVKNWFIETRPAYPPMTRIFKSQVAPGSSFVLDPEALTSLTADTVS